MTTFLLAYLAGSALSTVILFYLAYTAPELPWHD
jgi:membrane protein DedA with SNARE-associated domain